MPTTKSLHEKVIKEKLIYVFKSIILLLVAIFCISYFTMTYLISPEDIIEFDKSGQTVWKFIPLFLLFFLPFSYGFSFLISRKWLIPHIPTLIMFMGMMFLFASSLEILLTKVFIELISRPSWVYHVWPVHNASTSGVKFLIWPWYGLHYYFIFEALKVKKSKILKGPLMRGLIMPIDAMGLETLANLFCLLVFNSYYFFYLSPEFFHFTSLEIFLPYYLCGVLSVLIIDFLDRDKMPKVWIGIGAYLLALFIVFGLG